MQDASQEPIVIENPDGCQPAAVWSVGDTWLGLVLQVVLVGGFVLIMALVKSANARLMVGIIVEVIMLIPIALILFWRKISWKELGFRNFEKSVLGIGCGLLVAAYVVIIVHNLIMMALGVMTQGNAIFKVFDDLGSPALFLFVGVVVAPLTEEMFFRGFLFKGFRQKYGWKAALILSSLIFGISHLQLAAVIPTFLLGCVLAYVYHRTNSIYPGMILHFTVNAFGLCAAFTLYTLKDML